MSQVPTIWPENQEYLPPLIATAFLVVIPILAVFLSQLIPTSIRGFIDLPFVKKLVVLILLVSLVFTQLSAVILLGVGSSFNASACAAGIWVCLLVYVSQKVLLYRKSTPESSFSCAVLHITDCLLILDRSVFLMERVFLVHSHRLPGRSSRFQNKWWLISMVLFAGWVGVAIAMIIGRVSFLRRTDGACIIGLRLYATAATLSVDFAVNVFLTAAFVVPIWRSQFKTARSLARNSVIAALAALATSIANMLILTLQHGHQQSFVCLGSCVLDVAINATIVYWITRVSHNEGGDELETSARAQSHSNTLNNAHLHSHSRAGMSGLGSVGGHLMSASSGRRGHGLPTVASGGGVTVFSETTSVAEDCDTTFVPTRQGWRAEKVQVPPLAYLVSEEEESENNDALHGITEIRLPFNSHDSSDSTITFSEKDDEKAKEVV